MSAATVIAQLRAEADPARLPGMARVGIDVSHALGVGVPQIRAVAKSCGTDQDLARALWRTGIHEARILATLVADPDATSDDDVESWAADLSSWDVCDFAADLFGRTPAGIASDPRVGHAVGGVREALRVLDDRATRRVGEGRARPRVPRLFPVRSARASDDPRNEVKKGVSWALRQIGKRNRVLNQAAAEEARRILDTPAASARWIARDVLRELESEKTRSRLPD